MRTILIFLISLWLTGCSGLSAGDADRANGELFHRRVECSQFIERSERRYARLHNEDKRFQYRIAAIVFYSPSRNSCVARIEAHASGPAVNASKKPVFISTISYEDAVTGEVLSDKSFDLTELNGPARVAEFKRQNDAQFKK
jgi:hypothetical protein